MIKVSGVPFFLCRHFRSLADLPEIEYQEGLPTDNARLLREGELDLALIPSDEFAADGGYFGLDYGLGSKQRTDCLFLCSNSPAENLEKVYAPNGLSSTLLLFTFLLKRRWSNSPRIVSSRFKRTQDDIGPREGVLIRCEGPKEKITGFKYQYDLGYEWYSLTKIPFIYLIWSARPGRLNAEQLKMFHKALHKCVKTGIEVAKANSEVFDCTTAEVEKFFVNNFLFSFNDEVQQDLTKQFEICADQKLIPKMEYDRAFITMLAQEPSYTGSRHEDDIVHSMLCGNRLSMQDARVLLNSTNVPQLLAVASTKTLNFVPRISLRLSLTPMELEGILDDKDSVCDINRYSFDRVCIDSSKSENDLKYFENLIVKASQNLTFPIECFSTHSLLQKVRHEGLSLAESASRLAACGLHSVGPDSEMPYTQFSAERYNISIDELLRTHKWLQSYNIFTYCCVPGNQALSKDELVSHLHQLRTLQDFTRGSRWLIIEPYRKESLELKFLKKSAVSALFMDNISSTAIYLRDSSKLASCIQLACFVNEIFLETDLASLENDISEKEHFSNFIDTELSQRVIA
ncbi:MAG: hypothetical protein KDD56_02455 [Bdellovibrionales bacterium]|nr:hypothetical protein [Bdellovibrionales bacterium]